MRESAPTLLVDNGDVNLGYGRQPELKYETAMRAMSEMGYVAANVGEEDLRLGSDYLKYVSDFTGVPLISANIVDGDGAPVFRKYALRPIHAGDNAPTAAIIGLISTEFKDEIEELNPDLAVEEYEEELGRLVTELREKCDLLIVLAHAGEEETLAVAERFPRIDIIVASHVGDDPMPIPLAEDGVPVLFAGKRGMSVGVAKFSMQDGRAEFVSYEPKTLDSTIPDSPRILTLLEDYQQMIRVEKLLETAPRIKHEIAQFKGDDACRRCHSLSSNIYHKSKHAHAFDPLVEKGREYDPECVECHTIGFGYRSGFVSPETTPELKHVGCENCHGPGGKHIEAPTVEHYSKVEQEVCVACHTPDNSPTFVYSERIDKISHEEFFLCSAKICHWLD